MSKLAIFSTVPAIRHYPSNLFCEMIGTWLLAGKGSSDWAYAWVPIVGPLMGGTLGGLLWKILF